MELNTCEDIKYIKNSWIDFICDMDDILSLDFDIKYYNAHLGYIMTSRLEKNRQKQNIIKKLVQKYKMYNIILAFYNAM